MALVVQMFHAVNERIKKLEAALKAEKSGKASAASSPTPTARSARSARPWAAERGDIGRKIDDMDKVDRRDEKAGGCAGEEGEEVASPELSSPRISTSRLPGVEHRGEGLRGTRRRRSSADARRPASPGMPAAAADRRRSPCQPIEAVISGAERRSSGGAQIICHADQNCTSQAAAAKQISPRRPAPSPAAGSAPPCWRSGSAPARRSRRRRARAVADTRMRCRFTETATMISPTSVAAAPAAVAKNVVQAGSSGAAIRSIPMRSFRVLARAPRIVSRRGLPPGSAAELSRTRVWIVNMFTFRPG